MTAIQIIVWKEEGDWLGYLRDYPDYWTQGNTLEDLEEHLKDLYGNVTNGVIPATSSTTSAANSVPDNDSDDDTPRSPLAR